MTVTLHHLRPSLIALAAIFGASLMAERSAHGGTTCDPRKPAACCVGRPETCDSGCYLPQASAPSRTGRDEAASGAGAPAPGLACNPAACQCRSGETAAPGETSDRRAAGERPEPVAWTFAARPGQAPSATPVTLIDPSETERLKVPLHLLTTHLRF